MKTVLVCVTAQKSCRRIIECGNKLAEQNHAKMKVISIFPRKSCFAPNPDALEVLNETAMEYNAEMVVAFHDNPAERIREEILRDKIEMLVTGIPGKNSSDFISELHNQNPQTEIYMIDRNGISYNIIRPSKINQIEQKEKYFKKVLTTEDFVL